MQLKARRYETLEGVGKGNSSINDTDNLETKHLFQSLSVSFLAC